MGAGPLGAELSRYLVIGFSTFRDPCSRHRHVYCDNIRRPLCKFLGGTENQIHFRWAMRDSPPVDWAFICQLNELLVRRRSSYQPRATPHNFNQRDSA
jgi:hypothetical protein